MICHITLNKFRQIQRFGNINTSALLVFDRLTGKLLDSHYGCKGDIRSNVSHDPDSDRVFFTSKGGYIYNAAIDWETGRITDFKSLALKDAEGYTSEEKPGAIMSTCTPSVYNGRIYLGVSGNKGQFSQNGGHCIEVIDLDVESGEMSYAYSYGIVGYPQTSAMVSTAYVDKDFDGDGAGDGYVFIYLPYDYTPGGISVLMDRPGQTEPKTATDSGYSEIFTPESPLAQYCICSTIADSTGTIYYKNDSCYMMAITSKILSIEVRENPEKMSYKVGETFDASGMKVVAKLANGLERDITNYVTWQEGPIEQGQTSITLSYTYGFDSANYGLKTKTAELELDVLPSQDEDGVYLIGNASQLLWFASKVNSGETGISGKLTANIDLTSVESWTPIGSLKQPFTGSFDGDGHSITGMSITFDSDDKSIGAPYLGLFGYVKGTADKKAEIKNLMLSGKLDITENYRNSFAYSGGLVGGAEYVSFTDITTNVAVTAKKGSAPYPWSYVGGFAGTVKNADFLRCVNNGTVTTDGDYVSGFAAKSETTTYTSCVNNGAITGRTKIGGFGGAVKSTKTVDSYNTGTIGLAAYNGGNQGIGGLFGEMGYGSTLTRCYNTGAVTGDCYVGGLVGSVGSGSDAANGPSYIVDSYNSGSITGHSDKNYCGIGGLVGKLDASSSRVYEQSYVHNCYNVGTVTDLGLKTINAGAAIGLMHADYSTDSYLEVENVYYLACGLEGLGKMNYSTMHDPSVFAEMTAEAMKASDFVTKLGASFKADGTCMQKVNSGYPVLTWQQLGEGQSEHTFKVTATVDATCTEAGSKTYTCTACGETKAEEIPALGHNVGEDGICSRCGEKIAYLSALRLTAYNGSGDYAFTPEFDGKTAEYQVAVPDADGFSAFLWATLSENAPEGSTIKAEWTNLYNGKTQSTAITSGKTSGQSLANFSRDAKPNTVTLTVGVDGNTQTYTLTSFRTPTLSALNVTGARMNETFSHRTAEYTIDTTADSITLSATPYQDGYTVTYNGAESGEWTLQDGENVMTVVVSNADGLSTSYTVKATKHAICKVRAELDPENALLVMYDSFNTSIYPDENGDYALMDGAAYTYVATAKGYVGKSGSLTASAAEPVLKITLTAAEENTTLVKDLPAEWPNFRNGSNHLGITNAPTPYTSEDSELLWAAKYGTGWAAAPGSPILVDGGLITYTGSTIKRLDVNTGKVLAEGTMAGTSSFSINPATYADGMIFVGLSGGKIQAFNAKTLESLWVYTDPLGGQPNTSPTYHDGYIYVGFWNGESKPGNFVAISVTDEDPMKTDEAKLASWSYACVGGFYWAGAYACKDFVLVGTDDGEAGYTTGHARVLSFDPRSGRLLGELTLPQTGDLRSSVTFVPDSEGGLAGTAYFTTKGGYFYGQHVEADGTFTEGSLRALKLANYANDPKNPAMSTCTPTIYNGRAYIGVSGTAQFGAYSGHNITVIDLASMSVAYSVRTQGYPQTSGILTTAYEA